MCSCQSTKNRLLMQWKTICYISVTTMPTVGWQLHMQYHPLPLVVQRIPWSIPSHIFLFLFYYFISLDTVLVHHLYSMNM
jgi:hypothetical protein